MARPVISMRSSGACASRAMHASHSYGSSPLRVHDAGTPSKGLNRKGTVVLAVAAEAKSAPSSDVGALRKCRLITAVKTPYKLNGRFDLDAYDKIVEQQIKHGVDVRPFSGLIVGGTTGEGHLMTWDEHIVLIAHTVASFGDKITVIGNTGSNSTREAVHATENGFSVGMHAALQINPYYGKTSTAGLLQHFKATLDVGPGFVYNVPPRTAQDIIPEHMLQIADHSNFVGVKECMGNERIQGYTDNGVFCWSGNDDEAHTARHQHGAVGVISVTSNIIPGLFSHLMRERDDELAEKVKPLINWLFMEPNPIGLNTMCSMTGLSEPVFRLPYVPYTKEQREEGVQLIEELGPENVPGLQHLRALDDDDFTIITHH